MGFWSECRTIHKFANMSHECSRHNFLVEQFGGADCLCGLGSLTPQPRNFHSQCSCVCRHNRGKCHFISMLPQHWTLICVGVCSRVYTYVKTGHCDNSIIDFYWRYARAFDSPFVWGGKKSNIAEEMFLHALNALGIAPEHNSQARVLLTFGTLDSRKTWWSETVTQWYGQCFVKCCNLCNLMRLW